MNGLRAVSGKARGRLQAKGARWVEWSARLPLPLLAPVPLMFVIEGDWPRGLSILVTSMAILIGWPLIDRLIALRHKDLP